MISLRQIPVSAVPITISVACHNKKLHWKIFSTTLWVPRKQLCQKIRKWF